MSYIIKTMHKLTCPISNFHPFILQVLKKNKIKYVYYFKDIKKMFKIPTPICVLHNAFPLFIRYTSTKCPSPSKEKTILKNNHKSGFFIVL